MIFNYLNLDNFSFAQKKWSFKEKVLISQSIKKNL